MKAHAKTAIVFLLGLFAVACSDDDPTGPTKPNDQLELNSRLFVIAEIGDTANLVAWVGDQWTKTPDLVLHEETRWLSELPVLDSDRLAEGLIVPRAPGTRPCSWSVPSARDRTRCT